MHKPTKKRFTSIFIAIAALHVLVFTGYYFFLYLNKNASVADQPSFKIKDNSPFNRIPKNIPLQPSAKEKPLIYSWTDTNGVKHFSNRPPFQEVNDLTTTTEHVSDNLGSSEILARKLNSKPNHRWTTPVLIRGNQVFVPVKLGFNGIEAETMLLLDTGATITMVHREVAARLNLRKLISSTAKVADGRTVQSEIAVVDYIGVGPHTLRNFQTAIIDYHGKKDVYTGLLGMNFLRNINYKVDFDRSTITWNP